MKIAWSSLIVALVIAMVGGILGVYLVKQYGPATLAAKI